MHLQPPDQRGSRRQRRSTGPRRTQRGVTLLFALITLVALLLATLALVRSVDTSTILMGNIGFKQDATVTADQASKTALAWLASKSTVLNTDSLAQGLGQGYYASTKEIGSDLTTALDPVDVTGQQISGSSRQVVDWTHDNCTTATGYICSVAAATSGSNSARYVIFRLCSLPGDYTSTGYTGSCALPANSSSGTASTRGELNYAESGRFTGASGPYYRIVVRVQGARNTTSFTETIVHL
jgi:type IV pilus assembly protein PilX